MWRYSDEITKKKLKIKKEKKKKSEFGGVKMYSHFW